MEVWGLYWRVKMGELDEMEVNEEEGVTMSMLEVVGVGDHIETLAGLRMLFLGLVSGCWLLGELLAVRVADLRLGSREVSRLRECIHRKLRPRKRCLSLCRRKGIKQSPLSESLSSGSTQGGCCMCAGSLCRISSLESRELMRLELKRQLSSQGDGLDMLMIWVARSESGVEAGEKRRDAVA